MSEIFNALFFIGPYLTCWFLYNVIPGAMISVLAIIIMTAIIVDFVAVIQTIHQIAKIFAKSAAENRWVEKAREQ